MGGSSGNAVSLVFGADDKVTKLEYNEFKIFQSTGSNGLTAVTYNMVNHDETNLADLKGYKTSIWGAPTNTPYIFKWSVSDENYAVGDYYKVSFNNNAIAKGFWDISRANTKLEKG